MRRATFGLLTKLATLSENSYSDHNNKTRGQNSLPAAFRLILGALTILNVSLGLFLNSAPHPASFFEEKAKTIKAIRIEEPIQVDGRLTEKAWQTEPARGFTQSDPQDGAPATEETEVWVAYDDKAIYFAAFCYDSNPQGISFLLGRRDSRVDSDWFIVAIDPHLDRQTGYLFGVNPAGAIQDAALSNDVDQDFSWDPVWQAKAFRNDKGWSVEIRVPFNQIRFPKKEKYTWGINFRRIIKRKNEIVSFSWGPKSEQAFVSRFALLEGLEQISPGRNVEIFPYSVGQGQFRPAEEGNPFETGSKYRANLGLDAKVGLSSNLTLDMTFNPDFGQVEVDPAVINLSAYETYYQEKRPFFIEGASIFNGFGRGGVYINADINWPNPRFFYSRRIGRPPQGSPEHDGYAAIPDRSTILGALKFTGKTRGWNIGLINALTARERATVDYNGMRFKDEVEPLTYYGVFRTLKDISQGQHGLGVMATVVARDFDRKSLESTLNKRAFSLAMDGWSFLDRKRRYVFGGWIGGTLVEGTPADILRLQRSSLHYFQRPDASHVRLNPQATSLAGWGGRLNLAKQSGNFLFISALGVLSPGFDPNDAGFQAAGSDIINFHLIPGYMWTKPTKIFQQCIIGGGFFRNYNFGGVKTSEGFLSIVEGVFRNFWNFHLHLGVFPEVMSQTLTRGGPLALIPSRYNVQLNLESDSRRLIVFSLQSFYSRMPRDGEEWLAEINWRIKPRPDFSASFGPILSRELTNIQWVTRIADPLMISTFGQRYVFGHLDRRTVAAEIRLDLTFTPRLTLQAYLQPFVAVGKYSDFRELARPRSYDYRIYGRDLSTIEFRENRYFVDPDGEGPAPSFSFSNPDFNFKSLRGTVVLRWEYLPGSLLYLVWTQNRYDTSHPGHFRFSRDLNDLLTAPGDNIFLLKISYRWSL
ncbi:MAG: DUF5916 domain-containing protein [Candidatus Aminicenantales bacterium]